MAIKQFITLEGAEQVVANLKKISDAGEQALNQFRQSGQQFVPTDAFTNSLNQTSQSLVKTTSATHDFTESLHILRPILSEAGAAMGGIREFSIAAGTGIAGLTAAIVGTALIAIAKLSESLATAKLRLQDLAQTKTGGTTVIAQLTTDAQRLGTTFETLAPAVESFVKAFQATGGAKFVGDIPPGAVGNIEDAEKAATALFEALRNGGASAAEATAAVAKFGDQLAKGKQVTGDMVRELQKIAPGAANDLARIFSGGMVTNTAQWIAQLDKVPISLRQFQQAMTFVAPLVAQSFQPQKVREFSDAMGELWADLKTQIQALAGRSISDIVVGAIDAVRAGIDLVAAGIAKIQPLISGIVTNISNLSTVVAVFFGDLGRLGSAIATAFKTGDFAPALAALKNLFVNFFTNIKNDLTNAFGDLPARILAAVANIDWKGAFEGLIQAGVAAVGAAEQAVLDGFKALIQAIAGLSWAGIFDGLLSAARTIFQAIQTAWQALVNFINNTKFQPPQPGVGGAPSVTEFAGGGFVSGPGSTTSDSILARLSNFEYVMRAAAVKFYGVDFMHALNAMRLPKDFFRGFNLGGLVLPPFPSPARFAQGGLAMAGQSRSLTLVLDGRSFAMAGSKNVVDDLERAADLHNLSRMGRAPGWVR